MNYPVYRPAYSRSAYSASSAPVSSGMSTSFATSSAFGSSSSTITPVGAGAPRMLSGSGSGFAPLGEDDDFLDWGEGDGESQTGGTIGTPDGDYTAAGVPVGNACWPLLFFVFLYALSRTYLSINRKVKLPN